MHTARNIIPVPTAIYVPSSSFPPTASMRSSGSSGSSGSSHEHKRESLVQRIKNLKGSLRSERSHHHKNPTVGGWIILKGLDSFEQSSSLVDEDSEVSFRGHLDFEDADVDTELKSFMQLLEKHRRVRRVAAHSA